MDGPPALLFGILVPALVTGIGLLLVTLFVTERARERHAVGAAFAAAGFLAGAAGMFGLPPLPFGDQTLTGDHWLQWTASVGVLILLFDGLRPGLAFVPRALFGAATILGVVQAMLRHHWEGPEVWTRLATLAGLLAVLVTATALLGRRVKGASVPFVLLLAATCLAVTIGLTGSAKLAQLTGIVCSSVGAAWVLTLLRPSFRLGGAGLTWAVSILFGLGLCACFYSELPVLDGLLLCAAPLAPWLAELPPLRDRSPRLRFAARAILCLLPAGFAVTRAALAFDPDPYGDYDS